MGKPSKKSRLEKLYPHKEYLALRMEALFSLSRDEREKVFKVESLCAARRMRDPKKEYFYVYRSAYEIVYGKPPRQISRNALKSPLRKLVNYLVRRAGEIRGIQFSGPLQRYCTKENPFLGKRKENEKWTHVDAFPLDEDGEGRFFKCPHCGIIIDLGPDAV